MAKAAGQELVAKIREAVETLDFTTKEGKYDLSTLFRAGHRRAFQRLRDLYHSNGYSVVDSNKRAGLDIAKAIETGDESIAGRLEEGGSGGTDSVPLAKLVVAVREHEKRVAKCVGVAECIKWASTNTLTPVTEIKAEEVPGLRALTLWNWGRKNETEYRRLYDSKVIPVGGIREEEARGWFDSGAPIDDIMSRIQSAGNSCPLKRSAVDDVSVRRLQAPVQLGDDHKPDGGVHELPEPVVEGRGGDGSGEEGGSGSGSDGGSGAEGQAESGSDGALAGSVRATERPARIAPGVTATAADGEPEDEPINERLATVFDHACGTPDSRTGDSAEGET